jgi:hypothetical protein
LHLDGEVYTPPLARLSAEEQQLAEELILCGGNIKKVTEHFEITYPTLRKRLDRLIDKVASERKQDRRNIEGILGSIEQGEVHPDEGIRRIREMKREF